MFRQPESQRAYTGWKIHVRENRRDKEELITQRNWQHWEHNTERRQTKSKCNTTQKN
jgi:hypothetical protein